MLSFLLLALFRLVGPMNNIVEWVGCAQFQGVCVERSKLEGCYEVVSCCYYAASFLLHCALTACTYSLRDSLSNVLLKKRDSKHHTYMSSCVMMFVWCYKSVGTDGTVISSSTIWFKWRTPSKNVWLQKVYVNAYPLCNPSVQHDSFWATFLLMFTTKVLR